MAQCQTCRGSSRVLRYAPAHSQTAAASTFEPMIVLEMPCPDCGGSRIEYCCDGLCAQPEGGAPAAYRARELSR